MSYSWSQMGSKTQTGLLHSFIVSASCQEMIFSQTLFKAIHRTKFRILIVISIKINLVFELMHLQIRLDKRESNIYLKTWKKHNKIKGMSKTKPVDCWYFMLSQLVWSPQDPDKHLKQWQKVTKSNNLQSTTHMQYVCTVITCKESNYLLSLISHLSPHTQKISLLHIFTLECFPFLPIKEDGLLVNLCHFFVQEKFLIKLISSMKTVLLSEPSKTPPWLDTCIKVTL